MKRLNMYVLGLVVLLAACNKGGGEPDAYGNFQATEIMVSAETSGRIVEMPIEEGQKIEKDAIAVIVDSVQYYLKWQELEAKKKAVQAKVPNIQAQVAVNEKQREVLKKELNRFSQMLKDGAATPKQIDDLSGQIDVLDRQILAVKSQLAGIQAEAAAIEAGIAQAKDRLGRTKHVAPVTGVVLQKYAEPGEVTAAGKALFKMADLTQMDLKAYISGRQLSQVKLGQKVTVRIDGAEGKLLPYQGTVSWIASEAEFTPKNIQTREERLSQVYAIKVSVDNDGAIKINMPGEVVFNSYLASSK